MRPIATALVLAFIALPAVAQESTPDELAVIDLRPQEEKDGFGLAPLKGKCNKDVYRVPDVATDPIKVLGDGELTSKLAIHAHAFSASAKDKITKAGGTFEVVA